MIARADVARWCERPPTPDSPILSVYLDVDQANAANRNREFEVALRARLLALDRGLADAGRAAFRADARRVEDFVARYTPHAKSLVLFADDSVDLLWTGELRMPLPTAVRWEPTPYVRPLVAALDDHERYAVVLVDKRHSRVFTVQLGEIEEARETSATATVRYKNASGTDHWRSQMRFQRQDETHVHWHLTAVADVVKELAEKHAFDRLIVAGPVEATSELLRVLPTQLVDRVVGTLRLAVDAPEDVLLHETLRLAEDAERAREQQHVGQLFEGGTIGLPATLAALVEGRLQTLVYAEGFESHGGECLRCHALFGAGAAPTCAYCGERLLAIDDLVGRAVARAVGAGATVDQVHGEPASRLLDAGGIGAVLRY